MAPPNTNDELGAAEMHLTLLRSPSLLSPLAAADDDEDDDAVVAGAVAASTADENADECRSWNYLYFN